MGCAALWLMRGGKSCTFSRTTWIRYNSFPMASLTIATRPSKRKDGKLPLYIRIYASGKTRYLSLGLHVAKSHWSKKKRRVKRGHANAPLLNRQLSEARQEAEAVLHEMQMDEGHVTAGRLKKRIEARLDPDKDEAPPDFIKYSRGLLKTWRGRWAYQTYQAYKTAVNKLEEWSGGSLPFSDVTPAMCRSFQEHLARKGNSVNTRHKNLSTLKGFYKQAMEEEVIPWGRNPFDVLTLRKEAGEKEKLTTEELRKIRDLDTERTLLGDVKRWFLFAFYAGGMRFSDVAELERRHIEEDGEEVRVRYRMGKTKDLHAVLLVPEAVEILEYYNWREKEPSERVFPILDGYEMDTPEKRRAAIGSRNALANKYLKKIAKRAKVEKKVSFHLSRHSTAGYLLEQGYSVRAIQKVLGHANSRITEIYLEGFEGGGADDATQSLSL